MGRRWLIAVAGVLAAVVVAGGAFWYFVLRDDAPSEVSLQSATEALGRNNADSSSTTGGSAGSATSLDGTWTVDPSIGSFSDFSSSFAGYRVQEQLVGVGAKTAVGRTPKVTGSITIQGPTIPTASFEVDMTSLQSDESQRDDQVRTQGIETARFPKASFKLTQPIQLGSIPADGQKISVDAVGDLTLHGVTKSVTIPLEAQRSGTTIAVIGSLPIAFSDYSIKAPSSFKVLSIDDNGVMEFQLFLKKTA